ncbi:Uncharacterised protein [Slackia heliotrinireducens]|nr:Uncharacterised protein [Slackia heliotrinireducens]
MASRNAIGLSPNAAVLEIIQSGKAFDLLEGIHAVSFPFKRSPCVARVSGLASTELCRRVVEVKKALILVMMMACLLGVVVGCGSQSNTEPKDYGPPMDISLSTEETEMYGVHLLLPDNSPLEQSESDPNYAQTVANLDDSLTIEIVVSMSYFPGDEQSYTTNPNSEETYTPAAILKDWADAYSDPDSITVEGKTHIGGTAALVTTSSAERKERGGIYDLTTISLAMNSGYVVISYEDRGGRYGDLIQQSIKSIWIDEEEIPDFVRATSPEGLQAAGLMEQPWQIDCDMFSIYVNPPADFIPLERTEGNYEWIAPDGNTVISATVTDRSTFGLSEEDLEQLEQRMALTAPGFSDLEYSSGVHNDMDASKMKYKIENENGTTWMYVVTVAPEYSNEAIAVTVGSRSEDNVELPEMMNILRFADGWNNGGVLNMEEIAVAPESAEDQG